MAKLTVEAQGTTTQIAAALRDLARRVEMWDEDHAPMSHPGDEKIAPYVARYNDWEYAE